MLQKILLNNGDSIGIVMRFMQPLEVVEDEIYLACESIRFSFALRRWGRFAKRPQRRRAKEKRMLSQAKIYSAR